ncbi:hypothetical protein HHX47_DHR5001123 [Lentinula edodes]|nr:hypothetical protein HHX47_DHR5001123 [Lentinula edodes]
MKILSGFGEMDLSMRSVDNLVLTPVHNDSDSISVLFIAHSLGHMPMIWLVSNHPDQKVITQITEPTTEILRKAGLEIEENYREW